MKKHEELPTDSDDMILSILHKMIKFAVKILAILMVLVIFWGVGDVIYVLYTNLMNAPVLVLSIAEIFRSFAAFLVVLIAIEIYQNIVLYLRTDVLPIKLVVATALMAISRKVIIIDYNVLTPMHILAIAATVLALGVTYFLVLKYESSESLED